MKNWKWWHIVALALLIVGIVFMVLTIATDINDDVFLPVALCCILVANLLLLINNIIQNHKSRQKL